MASTKTVVYVCRNGHTVSNVYGREVGGVCPVYVLGLPCGQSLVPERKAR